MAWPWRQKNGELQSVSLSSEVLLSKHEIDHPQTTKKVETTCHTKPPKGELLSAIGQVSNRAATPCTKCII